MANLIGGQWRRESPLGEGGQGRTFRTMQVDDTGVPFVLKLVLWDGQNPRLRKEVEALAKLSHPLIPGLVDHGEHAGEVYIVTRFLGDDLQRVSNKRPLTVDDFVRTAVCLSEALEHAHENEVVHRDVKPNNVIAGEGGDVYLIDWALAEVDGASSGMTHSSRVVGNPNFAAPECFPGAEGECSSASDVYSLGKVLYWIGSNGEELHRENFTEERYSRFLANESEPIRSLAWWMLGEMVKETPGSRVGCSTVLEYARDLRDQLTELRWLRERGKDVLVDNLGPRLAYQTKAGSDYRHEDPRHVCAEAVVFQNTMDCSVTIDHVLVPMEGMPNTVIEFALHGPYVGEPTEIGPVVWSQSRTLSLRSPIRRVVPDRIELAPGAWYAFSATLTSPSTSAKWCQAERSLHASSRWVHARRMGKGDWNLLKTSSGTSRGFRLVVNV